jgi:hypothetical protein
MASLALRPLGIRRRQRRENQPLLKMDGGIRLTHSMQLICDPSRTTSDQAGFTLERPGSVGRLFSCELVQLKPSLPSPPFLYPIDGQLGYFRYVRFFLVQLDCF